MASPKSTRKRKRTEASSPSALHSVGNDLTMPRKRAKSNRCTSIDRVPLEAPMQREKTKKAARKAAKELKRGVVSTYPGLETVPITATTATTTTTTIIATERATTPMDVERRACKPVKKTPLVEKRVRERTTLAVQLYYLGQCLAKSTQGTKTHVWLLEAYAFMERMLEKALTNEADRIALARCRTCQTCTETIHLQEKCHRERERAQDQDQDQQETLILSRSDRDANLAQGAA